MTAIRRIPIRATRLLAICGKCGRKLDGGFGPGGKQSLAKAIKRALALPKPKHAGVRLVETRCLKLCPKGAVAVADSAAPGSLLVIAARTPLAAVAAALALARAEPDSAGSGGQEVGLRQRRCQRSRVIQAIASTSAATPNGTPAQGDPATSSTAAVESAPDSAYSESASSSEPRWRR